MRAPRVERWPQHPLFGFFLGATLASSAGAEVFGNVETLSVGVEHGVLVYGLARLLAATAVLVEGVQTAGEAAGEAGAPSRWVALATSRYLSLFAGLGLIFGSSLELLEEARELGSHHGTLGLGLLAVSLDLTHIVSGAGKLATAERWRRAVRVLESAPMAMLCAAILVVAASVEIEWGHLGELELGHEHGLLLFGFGRLIEAATRGLTEAEEVEEELA